MSNDTARLAEAMRGRNGIKQRGCWFHESTPKGAVKSISKAGIVRDIEAAMAREQKRCAGLL